MKMLLSEAIEALILATKANGRSAKTIDDYTRKLRPLTDFLGASADVGAVTVDDLRRYVVSLQEQETRWAEHPKLAAQAGSLSPFSVSGYVRAVKRLFNFLEAEGVIAQNPARRIKTGTPKAQTPKATAEADLLALLKTTAGDRPADLRDRAIILLLTDSGCRVSGLCGLTLEVLDLEREVAIVIEKGEKARAIMFTAVTAAALRAWLEVRPTDKGPFLFTSLGPKCTGGLSTGAVGEMLKRRAKRAGIAGRVNPHSFRHAFAREYLLSGGDMGTLSDIMGHSDIAVTKSFYAIFTLGELQAQHRKHSPVTKLFGGKQDASASDDHTGNS